MGNFSVGVERKNAPLGADHLYTLLSRANHYYDNNGFFRVLPSFVVQFGINGIPAISKEWEGKTIKDDPVLLSNTRGVLTYATAGPNTRTTQLFINYGDNSGLDSQGFSGVGTVVGDGMDIVDKIYSGYGQTPNQGQIYSEGNSYLKANFPNLDYIISATIASSDE